jgi:hypothetical protein
LFRGVLPNVVQAFPGGAVSMLAFEYTLVALSNPSSAPVDKISPSVSDSVSW